ncbi:MAG: hypothetical protein DLM72_11180 [Candidatus Nitrosopolaris wilkensis]|nr:MAG: hypothetical protein DLM72_11180 [Candidatus Nitrosopolaris wilkensis]
MSGGLNKLEFGKGTIYLFIEAGSILLSGYVFWLILSKLTTTGVIGISSAVITIATIFASIGSLGAPSGVQRFLGRSISKQEDHETKVFVKASLLIVCIGTAVCSAIIFIVRNWIYDSFHLDFNLLIVTIIILASSAFYGILRSVVIASLKTKILSTMSLVSTIIKIALATSLVLMGVGALGITISIASATILTSVFLSIAVVRRFFKSAGATKEAGLYQSLRIVLAASMAFWIPGLITTIGSQLGTIVVYGSNGASQAGIYFIALSIVTGITLIASALSTIAYPTISAMTDGRKRLAWRITKLALIATLPLSTSIVFYSKDVMQLFGKQYVDGASTLEVLLLSILPGTVLGGVGVLVYSYGNNKRVLIVGLSVSISRTISYFVLVPIFGGIGAALSYTIGTLVGFLVSLIIARTVRMRIFWREVFSIFAIPTGCAFLLSHLGIYYIPGIIGTVLISYVIFSRVRILDKSDLHDALEILPRKIADPTSDLLLKLNLLEDD